MLVYNITIRTGTRKMNLELMCQIATGIMIPVLYYLLTRINETNKQLNDFKFKVASEFVNKEEIRNLEQKIDNLQKLIIENLNK